MATVAVAVLVVPVAVVVIFGVDGAIDFRSTTLEGTKVDLDGSAVVESVTNPFDGQKRLVRDFVRVIQLDVGAMGTADVAVTNRQSIVVPVDERFGVLVEMNKF